MNRSLKRTVSSNMQFMIFKRIVVFLVKKSQVYTFLGFFKATKIALRLSSNVKL